MNKLHSINKINITNRISDVNIVNEQIQIKKMNNNM